MTNPRVPIVPYSVSHPHIRASYSTVRSSRPSASTSAFFTFSAPVNLFLCYRKIPVTSSTKIQSSYTTCYSTCSAHTGNGRRGNRSLKSLAIGLPTPYTQTLTKFECYKQKKKNAWWVLAILSRKASWSGKWMSQPRRPRTNRTERESFLLSIMPSKDFNVI